MRLQRRPSGLLVPAYAERLIQPRLLGRRVAGHGGRLGRIVGASVLSVPSGGGGGGEITVTDVSPVTALVGDTLTITGTGFAGGQAVLCGGITMDNVTVNSSTEIVADVPTGVAYESALTVSVGGVSLVGAVTVYRTPDLLNNHSFESGWDGWQNWSNQDPDGVTRATDYAYAGAYSVKGVWTSGAPEGAVGHFIHSFTGQDRAWVRFYFRVTAHITSTWKWGRVADTTFANFGGLWLEQDGGGSSGNGLICWGWDLEDGAIITTIGLTEAQVIDGNWHSLEFDFWRNGDPSGWPSVALWFDGTAQYAELNGHTTIKYWGAGNNSYWDAAGRLQAGERSTSSPKIGYQTFMSTLNAGNTTSGQCNIDRVAVSSLGRIGP